MKISKYVSIVGAFFLSFAVAAAPAYAISAGGGIGGGGGGGGAPSGPAGGDLSGTYPNPTVVNGSNLGAATVPNAALVTTPLTTISGGGAQANKFVSAITSGGAATLTQPTCGNLSNAAASCSTDATNATNISSGTLPAGRLPTPGVATLGGVNSKASVLHQFLTQIGTDGSISQAQPACGDLSNAAASCSTDTTVATNISSGTLPAGRLPNPGASSLGGVNSKAAVTHQFLTQIGTDGSVSQAQPAASDISGLAASATTDTTVATNISSGTLPAGRLPALTGDVTSSVGSAATTAVGSSNLQQPIMPIGTGTFKSFTNATTTGTINSPPNVANGDQEVVVLVGDNATSSAFTPPAGWTLITSCSSQGNTRTALGYSHTASSEGATIAAFTWTTNMGGFAWATAFRNASIDVCAASTAAAGTTATSAGFTAAATSDRRMVAMAQTAGGSAYYTTTAAAPNGLTYDGFGVSAATRGAAQMSHPITSTTVAGLGLTSGLSSAWAMVDIGISYVTSTTAGVPGAITYGQYGAFLQSLVFGSSGLNVAGNPYNIILPATTTGATNIGGIGSYDSSGGTYGPIRNLISQNGTAIVIGDSGSGNGLGSSVQIGGVSVGSGTITLNQNVSIGAAKTMVGTTGGWSTSTGFIGPTGGGVLQSYGGTIPTLTAGCNGSGSSLSTGSSNTAGQITTQTSGAATTCTLTFSASGTFHAAPICILGAADTSVTGLNVGAVSTSTAVFNFGSATGAKINYHCIGQ